MLALASPAENAGAACGDWMKMGCRAGERLLVGAAACALWGFGWVAPAQAQELHWTTGFDPGQITAFPTPAPSGGIENDENVSVRDRPHPEFDTAGIRTGGFTLYPSVTATATYDDNIFVVPTAAEGDAIFSVQSEMDIQSHWSRNLLWAFANASQTLYAVHSGEDVLQASAGVGGEFQFGDAALTAGLKYGQYVLPRSLDNAGLISARPLVYDYTGAFVGLSETLNRLKFSVRADDQIYQYRNGQTSDGRLVFELGQNRNIALFTGKAEYAVSPSTTVYLSSTFNLKTYELSPPAVPLPLNSQGYRLVGGAEFDLSHLLRGDIQVGYQDQTYASPLFREIKGLSAYGQIEWLVTSLTTITVSGTRTIGDAGVINSAGYLTTAGGVQIDHELLRNLILSADVTADHDQYQGLSRTDDHLSVGFAATWRVGRRLVFTLAYAFTDQRSTGAAQGPSFQDNRVSVSTSVRF